MNPGSTDRLSRRTVVIAFGIAIGAAVMLVVAALVLRNANSAPAASATPVVDLEGIPQSGSILGSPSAKVTLIEYADPQRPACRLYTETEAAARRCSDRPMPRWPEYRSRSSG